jgi:2,4-diaminopentanoate dehydrogenase
MRKDKVKVAIWGFGAMGSGMARMILNKKGFEIVGVCDKNPHYHGKSMFEVLQIEQQDHKMVIIKDDIQDVISKKSCDVCLVATDSFTDKTFPKLEWLLKRGVNVISTAEEMAYPYANQPELSKQLDHVARANNVTVLGTGINPGMMMDLLVVCLSGVMESVDAIEVSRVNSLSPFGHTVMEEQGVGLTKQAFEEGIQTNTIAGHVGFKESIYMIGKALGWNIEKFEQSMAPIITTVDRKSAYGFAKANDVAGVDMRAHAIIDGVQKIKMHHPQQIEPHLGGVETGDYIKILGKPEVNMAIKPEIDGGIGTIAICVNMIPHVINAKSGLKTMLDLPVPRAILGDVREMIE